ncbi:MAG: glutathione S-transferase [Rhodobacteraceae bacterium]|nr:glutathione S-transferase [Paracoccaceae bacterium]
MIRLHHVPESRSMRVLWMLHELGLDFELAVHPFDKSLRDPTYLAVHPGGRVPALEIDDTVLFESGAALEYLCARHPQAGLGCAFGHADYADWLNWLHFAESISQHTAALTQQHVAIYPAEKRSPLVTKLEAARLAKLFQALDARLSGRDTLLESGFSAADIGVGQALYMAKHFVRLGRFERLNAYYERLSARTAFQKSLPADGDMRLYQAGFYEVLNG